MMAALCIDRCVCMNVRFAALLPLARENGWNAAELIRETGCGDQCGLCRPYLRNMLATDVTEFDHILDDYEEDPAA